MNENLRKKYIPMTETTYYTLLAVICPRHGYAIIQYVSALTQGKDCSGYRYPLYHGGKAHAGWDDCHGA